LAEGWGTQFSSKEGEDAVFKQGKHDPTVTAVAEKDIFKLGALKTRGSRNMLSRKNFGKI
jgi:hypothetical protein